MRAARTLTCAAEPRPGFADADEKGDISGLAVDLCRAVAIAALGPDATVHVALPESEKEFSALAGGGTDLAFLTGEALEAHHLRGERIAGPTVFIDPLSLMVPVDSPVQHPADVAGQVVCAMIGSPAHRALEAALGGLTPPIARSTYREDVEMLDGYNVSSCTVVAEANSRLAEMRLDGGINHVKSRILTPPLALTPVFATAPTSDGRWAALAFAVLEDLAGQPAARSGWDGAAAEIPGLRPGWREDVRKAVGDYAAMRERHMGKDSPLDLPAWPNAPWPDGLLMPIQK